MHIILRLVLLLMLAIVSISMAAQEATQDTLSHTKNKKERRLTLYGNVYDSFTKAALKAHMTLMTADSVVIDTTTCWQWTWGLSKSYYQFRVPRQQAKYIIKASLDGYEDTFINYNIRYIARNNNFEVPRHLMKKRLDDDIYGEDELEGVTIRGTKIKITYKGDTIVYNASAFNLPEGSMLDGLIRQMPGAELKDNGDIYVNGKKVDYLTLNGNDFFKGNNKIMLENLPYFTVQNVQVYHKQSERSKWKGRDVEKKDYVMDVRLKREYNQGTLVTTEAGAGTDNRWLARLFALYYNDHTRLSVFSNVNNINENRQPGQEGEWSPANMPQGLHTSRQIGLHLTTEDADKNMQDRLNTTLEWSKNEDENRTSRETFSTGGNILGGSASLSRQDDFRFTFNNQFTIEKPFQLWNNVSVGYYNGTRHFELKDSTLRDVLINRTMKAGLNKYRSISLNQYTSWSKKLPWGDELELFLSSSYNNNKPSESFSLSRTYFVNTGKEDLRNRYADTHSNSYNYEATAKYEIVLGNWTFAPGINYEQDFQNSHNYNYRLDWLANVPDISSDLSLQTSQLGWLPSNDLLMKVLDEGNSDSHGNLKRKYTGRMELWYFNEDRGESFSMRIDANRLTEKMRFTDDIIDTIARRSTKFIDYSLGYNRWGKGGFKSINYYMKIEQPDFASLMPADDTTNPLAHTINNPGLKNRRTHSLYTNFNFRNDSTEHNFYIVFNGTLVRNAWGTRTSYDSQTGVYTYMQDNVNGNWNARTRIGYSMPIDKKKRLRGDIYTRNIYTHSVDFDIAYDTDETRLSRVNTIGSEGGLTIKYQYEDFSVGINGKAFWQHSTSTRENFEKINAWDYQYGMNATYTIPWVKLTVATDINMFSRRGYNSDAMNTNDLVWNASLSKSFWKGKLIAKLMTFDLLHEISSKQYTVNAQGRYETWNNCLPRYAMLTLSYKFQKMPKNKKEEKK